MNDTTSKPQSVVKLYKSPHNGWRWRRRDKWNHKIIAASTQGYSNRAEACANYERLTGFGMYPGFVRHRVRCFAWLVTEIRASTEAVRFVHTALPHAEALKW